MEKEAVVSNLYYEYNLGNYRRVLEELEQLDPSQRETGELSYIRLCSLSQLGRETEALSLLDDLAQKNIWIEPTLMMEDGELRCLQDSPEFRRLCRKHSEIKEEETTAGGGTRTVYPDREGPYPLLLVLHGNQQNAAETISHWDKASRMGWMVTALESKQTGCGRGSYVWNDYSAAREQILDYLRQHRAEWNGTLVIGGFSRGARTAITVALEGLVQTAGVMAVCPAELSGVPSWTVDIAAVPVRATVFLGASDPYTQDSEELERCLTHTGSEVTYRVIDGLEHAYPENFGDCVAGILQKIPQS